MGLKKTGKRSLDSDPSPAVSHVAHKARVQDHSPAPDAPSRASGVDSRPTQRQSSSSSSQGRAFSHLLLEDVLLLEICAGSARLTKTARKFGLRGLAIDKTKARSCGVDILLLDLTNEHDFQFLCNLIQAEHERICLVFISPPCGTASRARARPIKSSLLRGRQAPKPLRTDLHPDQKPGLTGTDKIKVELANQLYDAVTDLILFCDSLGLAVVVENPLNSLYWKTSYARRYLTCLPTIFVDFHNCARGGSRDKLTRFWCNCEWFCSLSVMCDKQHSHASWKPRLQDGVLVFPTAEEAAYPFILCERIVAATISAIEQLGCKTYSSLGQQLEITGTNKMNRIIFGALPRAAYLKPLVADYIDFHYIIADPQRPDAPGALFLSLPKGTKLLSRRMFKWGECRVVCNDIGWDYVSIDWQSWKGRNFSEDTGLQEDTMVEIMKYGIPSEPEVFLNRAIEAGHPRDLIGHVGELIHGVIVENFHGDPFKLAKRRTDFLKKYSDLAVTLRCEELKLRAKMPRHVRDVLKNKRLALMAKMLTDLGFPDTELVSDICKGFDLSGWQRKSEIFPPGFKSPSITLDGLLSSAQGLNKSTEAKVQRRQEPDLEKATWVETEAELDKAWLWIDPDQDWKGKVVARRFGIRQGEKVRTIDDCSACGLNQTVGLQEKFQLHTVDQLCTMIAHSFELARDKPHPPLLGRTFDLKSAYKQYAISEETRSLLRIVVNRPEDTPLLVGLNTLPFGAVASVGAFLRISMAIWWIGLCGMGVCWTAYFDDFSVVTRPELEQNTSWAVQSLFRLLGIIFAEEGSEAPPFDHVFRMLGLEIDARNAPDKNVLVGHTATRRAELVASLNDVLEKKLLSPKEAQRLRGRMIFFECYTFGRAANLWLKQFGKFCRDDHTVTLTEADLDVVLNLRDRVAVGRPVSISTSHLSTWLIFTDGAVEGVEKVGSVGGLIVSPNHQILHHFGGTVPKDVMARLLLRSKHPIHEVEILPILISFLIWGELIRGAQVVHFLDNESARFALLKGAGETAVAQSLIFNITKCELEWQTRSWYSRVPSFSNPADDPSRDSFEWLISKGSTPSKIPWDTIVATAIP